MTSQAVPQNGDDQSISSNHSRVNPSVVKRIHREVRFGSYILGSTLGEGEFGKVKLGWRKDGRQPSQVAIKLIKRDTIMKDSESEIKIHREINSLKLLSHPNIVNLVEVMKSGKYIGIVLEYASGGELFDYILQHKYLKENVAKKLFAQLVSGVDYMHSKGLIHRDLKLENLLLDKHKNVIISDFGFVNSYNKDKNDLMKTSCGSPCYAAPELVLTQSPYEGRKVDIWSLGVILYAMLSGYLPFDDDPENEDGSDIVRLYNYICKTPLTFPEYVSPLARDLLRKIIVPDPKKRINLNEIRNHPWLAPYANLLSIRQLEWDRIHKENRDNKTINNNQNKRFSMINERTNSSSLMMSNSNRSYSTTNIGHLYSNPSTSSSLANAVALPKIIASSSSSEVQSIRSSPSPTKPVYSRGHTKSASLNISYPSASTALKAMVSDNKRSSMTSLDSLNQPVFTSPTTKATYHFPSPTHLPRSTTYTGTAISTIAESPTKPESRSPPTISESFEVGSKLSPPTKSSSSSSSRDSNKLPHSTKKPRPTSYHPSSITSSLMQNNNQSAAAILDYIKIPSTINLPIPQFLSNSPIKASPTSENSVENASSSPTAKSITSIQSRRDSVVTHIHVNGFLTSETTNLNSHEDKRNSVLSYLEDKMDTLELTDVHSPTKNKDTNHELTVLTTTPQINQTPIFDTQTVSPIVQLKDKVEQSKVENKQIDVVNKPANENPAKPLKEEAGATEKEFNDLALVPENNISSESSFERNTDKQQEAVEMVQEKSQETVESEKAEVLVKKASPKEPASADRVSQTKPGTRTQKLYKDSIERKPTNGSSRRENSREPKDASKENKENKRRNRFSLLSFYSGYNSSSSAVSIHSSSGQSKRILEPSVDINVMTAQSIKSQNRIGSNSSSKSANSKKSNSSSPANSSSANGKEASAARKVMDFFKRRSVRIS